MYFLAYLIKNIHKVNIVGPMDKNVRPKRYGGPCMHPSHKKKLGENVTSVENFSHFFCDK